MRTQPKLSDYLKRAEAAIKEGQFEEATYWIELANLVLKAMDSGVRVVVPKGDQP